MKGHRRTVHSWAVMENCTKLLHIHSKLYLVHTGQWYKQSKNCSQFNLKWPLINSNIQLIIKSIIGILSNHLTTLQPMHWKSINALCHLLGAAGTMDGRLAALTNDFSRVSTWRGLRPYTSVTRHINCMRNIHKRNVSSYEFHHILITTYLSFVINPSWYIWIRSHSQQRRSWTKWSSYQVCIAPCSCRPAWQTMLTTGRNWYDCWRSYLWVASVGRWVWLRI